VAQVDIAVVVTNIAAIISHRRRRHRPVARAGAAPLDARRLETALARRASRLRRRLEALPRFLRGLFAGDLVVLYPTDDEADAAQLAKRVLAGAKDANNVLLVGGALDAVPLHAADLEALAKAPPLRELRAEVGRALRKPAARVGRALRASPAALGRALKAPAAKLGRGVAAKKRKDGDAGEGG